MGGKGKSNCWIVNKLLLEVPTKPLTYDFVLYDTDSEKKLYAFELTLNNALIIYGFQPNSESLGLNLAECPTGYWADFLAIFSGGKKKCWEWDNDDQLKVFDNDGNP